MNPALFGWMIGGPWIAWVIYWLLSGLKTKAIARQESVGSRLSHIVPVVVGALLVAHPRFGFGLLLAPIFTPSDVTRVLGFIVLLAGLSFTVWARVHLGGTWSGTVTVKEGPELIRTGPYGIVRHPIYTGLLVAFLGTAVMVDQWKCEIGLPIIIAAFVYKLRIEERYMTGQFGEAYDQYKKQVPALFPGIY